MNTYKNQGDETRMSELKTLNDMDRICTCGKFSSCTSIFRENLKQEAIKWIKYRIKNCSFSCRENHNRCKEHIFWMERFNITEDELK